MATITEALIKNAYIAANTAVNGTPANAAKVDDAAEVFAQALFPVLQAIEINMANNGLDSGGDSLVTNTGVVKT